jgi:hypothetical protein
MTIFQDAVFVHEVTFDLFTKTGKLFLKMSLIFFSDSHVVNVPGEILIPGKIVILKIITVLFVAKVP